MRWILSDNDDRNNRAPRFHLAKPPDTMHGVPTTTSRDAIDLSANDDQNNRVPRVHLAKPADTRHGVPTMTSRAAIDHVGLRPPKQPHARPPTSGDGAATRGAPGSFKATTSPTLFNPSPVMKVDSLKKLYIHELKDLHSAEKQLLEALPKMAQKAAHTELRQAFEAHLKETRGHVDRLEKIFRDLEFSPSGERCEAMEGLIKEGENAIDDTEQEDVRDAAMIASAQRVEHYEIAAYGTARTYAEMLGRNQDVRLLQETLDEEKATDQKLNTLALEVVNPAAAEATA
jgi:ferritin-like metal-binding protein YciE